MNKSIPALLDQIKIFGKISGYKTNSFKTSIMLLNQTEIRSPTEAAQFKVVDRFTYFTTYYRSVNWINYGLDETPVVTAWVKTVPKQGDGNGMVTKIYIYFNQKPNQKGHQTIKQKTMVLVFG